MPKQSSVTILITVKNSARTIKECIDSVMKQNYKNYSVYVTDAYSTDGTWEILKSLKKKYGKKLKIERVKGNIARSHNYMIKNVKSDFIAFTDADCVVDKNWLKNLISGFSSEEIIATTGFCSTPKKINWLQKLIGLELEHRFKNFPEFVSRAPTMNLCVKTSYAKKVKFNEKLEAAQETDWGYRLTKLGKMRYVSKAVVYHYHRPTLRSYFIQQFKYGKQMPLIYLKQYKEKITGDHISTRSLFLQLLFFDLTLLFFFFSTFFKFLFSPSIFLLIFLFSFYLYDILKFTRSIRNILGLLFIYFLRVIAWTIGILVGLKTLMD